MGIIPKVQVHIPITAAGNKWSAFVIVLDVPPLAIDNVCNCVSIRLLPNLAILIAFPHDGPTIFNVEISLRLTSTQLSSYQWTTFSHVR